MFWETENMAMAMYLDKILGSKTKVNVSSVLVGHPERSIVENELAKEADTSKCASNSPKSRAQFS